MADERCRITVVGERRQVDLAVPARAPIAEYIDDLARMCELEESELMPAAWSLATGTGEPFAPEHSLAEIGVADGQLLYLRDVVAGEFDEPVIQDVAEQVTEASERLLDRRWDARSRTVTVMACGLAWWIGALVLVAALAPIDSAVTGTAAAALGLVLPALGWLAAERRWSVPGSVRLALALCAIPALAIASWELVAQDAAPQAALTPAGVTALSLAGGVLVGAVLACVASMGVTTAAVLLGSVIATVLTAGLALLQADTAQCAAVISVVAFGLLLIAPATAGRVAAFGYRRHAPSGGTAPEGPELESAVRTAMLLLALWGGALSLAAAVALVLLGSDGESPFAAAITACIGLGLVLRAGSAKVVVEVAPVGIAGAIGLFTLLLAGPDQLDLPAWSGPVASLAIGAVLVLYGFRRLMRPELPPLRRPTWFGGLGAVLGAFAIPLTVAAFGVFGQLMGIGRNL
ncbi:type VII secretion integral membrane protein EccD [Streptomyces pinistramenti]|uniref:type VII secretion integral membrane protein EccD n=1 Tax=Streptomyces pinistramenti TaxID=2884812 RepID=UPI001D072DFC|nr:type VII secretion integral membrane protein EccD [Streptomyces pinistramenti]MCB5906953.1 type VII secretion integral membrane protein EccD [Streptomyces pinistramenti]